MILKNFAQHCGLHAKVKLDTYYCLSLGNSGIQQGQYSRKHCSLASLTVFHTVLGIFLSNGVFSGILVSRSNT